MRLFGKESVMSRCGQARGRFKEVKLQSDDWSTTIETSTYIKIPSPIQGNKI